MKPVSKGFHFILTALLVSHSSVALAGQVTKCSGLAEAENKYISPMTLEVKEIEDNPKFAFVTLKSAATIAQIAAIANDPQDSEVSRLSIDSKKEGKIEMTVKNMRGRDGLKDPKSFYALADITQEKDGKSTKARALLECKQTEE